MKTSAVAAVLNKVVEPSPQQKELLVWLAALYAGLAEALAVDTAVPDWLALPGQKWPVWDPANRLAAARDWPAMQTAVLALAELPGATLASRLSAFKRLGAGNGRTPLMLYESQYLNGRFLGPETLAIGALYNETGLELCGAELPDHAAVELEFLSFLTEREEEDAEQAQKWSAVRRRFLNDHANRWLPQVAGRLARSGDGAWMVVGLLLTAVLAQPNRPRHHHAMLGLPTISVVEDCTLCGFCAQTCPTRALRISENDQATQLVLLPGSCIHCGKCAQVCDERAMMMNRSGIKETAVLLHESPRAACPHCGQPTVSQAELDAIVHRLGAHPAWLDTCLRCR